MAESGAPIPSIIAPALTRCRVNAGSKKRVLEFIAELVAGHHQELNDETLFNTLISRERLGSTGIGHGIAIPHCRLEDCEQIIGAMVTLEKPVSFDAIDDQPVDILFALIVPQEAPGEHLDILSKLATRFNDPAYCERLRACETDEALYQQILAAEGASIVS